MTLSEAMALDHQHCIQRYGTRYPHFMGSAHWMPYVHDNAGLAYTYTAIQVNGVVYTQWHRNGSYASCPRVPATGWVPFLNPVGVPHETLARRRTSPA